MKIATADNFICTELTWQAYSWERSSVTVTWEQSLQQHHMTFLMYL